MRMLLGVLMLLIFIYFLVIILYKEMNDVSFQDAIDEVNTYIRILVKGIKKLLNPEPIQNYGIYLGFDGNGNPMSNKIDTIFSDVGKIYSVYTFYGYRRDTNRLIYRFKVSQPINSMTEEELYNYCTSLCDSIVQKEIQRRNPLYQYLESLVSVSIYPGFLDIYIAENAEGQHENAMQTEKAEIQFKMSQFSPSTPLETNWNDN